MAELILHHYPTSPFSEKVRLILGYKRLAWRSVIIPVIMPKPDVTALTGGYRKTPFLQIGADIYCDSALIADVLERIQPTPTLFPEARAGAGRILAQWADSTLFWTAVPYTMQPAGIGHIFAGLPPEGVKAFAVDRAAFRGNAPRASLGELTGHLRMYLEWMAGLFADGRVFMSGAGPGIADFSIYHSLWFILRAPPVATILDAHPKLIAWCERMQDIGHGVFSTLTSDEAIAVAKASTPAPIGAVAFADAHGFALGDRVSVMPTDTGLDPVDGELVIDAPNEIAIRRTDPRVGVVVVHFPRVGFQVKRPQA